MNPCHLKQGVDPGAARVFKRAAVAILALCLTAVAAAPSRAQHAAAAPKTLAEEQHLPTPLISRIPLKLLRAEAGARGRWGRRPVLDDRLTQKTAAPSAIPAGVRARPRASTAATVTITSTVQTQDVTYPSYTFNSAGALQGATPNNQDPFFSTTESYIYFSSDRTSATNPAPDTTGAFHLYATSPGGSSTPIQLTGVSGQATTSAAGETFLGERYPSVIADNTIAYAEEVKTAAGGVHYDLYVATLSPSSGGGITLSSPKQITGLATNLTGTVQLGPYVSVSHPSIVGQNIAFAGVAYDPVSGAPVAGAHSHIYIYQGTYPITQLTGGSGATEADEANPSLSPDELIVAFDSNASGYASSGSPGLTSGGTKANRDIWLSNFSGTVVNQFTQPAGNTGVSNNIEPIWSQPVVNTFFNPNGNFTYLFFSSDRNAGVYDIYYLRAVDRNPVPPTGQLVVDLEGQTNQTGLATSTSPGTNLAERVDTSSPNHATDDQPVSLQQPIENLYPAVSVLNQYISVAYLSNRYVINGVDDNPVNPTDPLANQSLLPSGAQDIEPVNLATDPTPNQAPINFSYDVLSSRLIAIDPPQLLNYDPTSNEIIHIEDTSAGPSLATRSVGPGNTARFILRLSERQTGVSKAFIQVKNPNSKYQDSLRLEHKVFSRFGVGSDPLGFGPYSDHPAETNESTTTFLTANGNGDFDLNGANNIGGTGGAPVYANAIAGNSGDGAVEVGDVLPYTGAPVTTVVTTAVTGVPPSVITSLQVSSAANFEPGDTVRITVGPGMSYDLVLNGIAGPANNVYTFSFSNPRKEAFDVPLLAPVQVVDRFDPQGQEVDCDAMDAIDYSPAAPPTVDNYSVPLLTAGFDDALILSGYSLLHGNPGVIDPDRGPLNAVSGNAVWLQLTPFVPSSDVKYAVVAKGTIIPVTETSGIVPGDSVQIGSGATAETVTVSSVGVAQNMTISGVSIADGTPLIILDSAAPLAEAHSVGAPITLLFSPSGGVLYEASFITPTAPSDYYLDAVAFDNATYPLTAGDGVTTPAYDVGSGYAGQSNNWRIYDNIWGFSTQAFTQQSGVLVVNDYALPQKFFTGRFGQANANNLPVTEFGAESYLTDIEVNNYVGEDGVTPAGGGNFGGVSHAVTPNTALAVGNNIAQRGYIVSNDDANTFYLGYPNTLGVNSYTDQDQENVGSAETIDVAPDPININGVIDLPVPVPQPQSQKYDIWRILARGPVPSSVLSDYAPTTVFQPDVSDGGTHPVQVASGCVLWVSPFAGDLFVGDGTIIDPATQADLETYVNAGGRLFVEGIDVGYALTNDGAVSNTFYTDYLRASFVADNTGFTAPVYQLGGKGGANTNFISNDAYRNNAGTQVVHRGFSIPTPSGAVTYDEPYKNAVTIAHTPFTLNFIGVPVTQSLFTYNLSIATGVDAPIGIDDTTVRTDGSLNAGLGDFTIDQGYVDAVNPDDPAGQPAPFFRPASVDLFGSGTNGKDQLLYYFGVVPLTANLATSAAVAVGATQIPVPSTSGIAPGDVITIGTGTTAETFTVASLTTSSTGTPLIVASAALTKAHVIGSVLSRTASTTYTNFVGYSSFGLETLSQELAYMGFGTTPVTDTFVSYNQRVNIMHNLICTMRTGTITGIVRSTATGNTPVGGAFVEVTLMDNATGKSVTYTAISQAGTGRYTIQGAIPGLYAYNANAAGFSTTHTVATTLLHGDDTVTQDINVNPVNPGAVTVSVVDTANNPVPGVVVTLTEVHNAVSYTATTATATDPNTGAVLGTAVFPSVLPSSFGYIITYVAAKYDTSTDPNDPTRPKQTPANPVIAVSGQTVAVKTVLSPKPATVFGLVTVLGGPDNGQPLTGATVTFTNAAGTVFTTTTGSVFSGSDSTTGNTLLANYPLDNNPGFTLPASPAGIVYTYSVSDAGYVTQTGTITLTTAEARRVNVALPLAGFIKLIAINSATGQPIATPITATATAPGETAVSVVSGTTVPVVPNAAWTVTLPAADGGASQAKAVTAGNTTIYTFTITPAPGAITGTVTDLSTTSPITGAVVTITNANGTKLTSAATGANGVYAISNVPSGLTYTATVTAPGYTGTSATGLAITPGTTLTQNFMLSSIYGAVSGTITDSVTGLGVSGASVTVTGGGHTYTGTTNSSGLYTINNVLGGVTYTVTATAASYLAQSKTATVTVSQTATVSFILVSDIIHRYPSGLQMFSAPYDYTGQALATILTGEVSKTTGAAINLVAAWIPSASAYALTPASPCETIHIGQGYWARFGSSGGVLMATGKADTSATATIGLTAGWNMIGTPYTASQTLASLLVQDSAGNTPVSFATATSPSVNFVNPQLYSYDQSTNTYTLVEVDNPLGGAINPSLAPYVGYWIYAYTNCSLIFTKPS